MAKGRADGSQTDAPADLSKTGRGEGDLSRKLRGLDSNPQGYFGPPLWQGFRDTVAHLYTVSPA